MVRSELLRAQVARRPTPASTEPIVRDKSKPTERAMVITRRMRYLELSKSVP
jgi:hypothetical protein